MANDVTQGFSQFLSTYGPGAMMDLPDLAVIVSGLQGWNLGGPGCSKIIEEERLARLLTQLAELDGTRLEPGRTPMLRTPPLHDPEVGGSRGPGVDVRIFPEWFVCDVPRSATPQLGETRRRMVEFRNLDITSKGLSFTLDGEKVRVGPIRFVAACANGHLRDIDWRRVIEHKGGGTCNRPLHWVERGVSSDPSDVTVQCDCGGSVSLANLHIPKRLGTCDAFSPWLPRPDPPETCEQELKLLPRSATNAYFPQTVSVISLPLSTGAAGAAVDANWSTIAMIADLPDFLVRLRKGPLGPSFKTFSDPEIEAAIRARGSAAAPNPDPRIEEFDLLSSGAEIIGTEGIESRLLGRTLDLSAVKVPPRVGQLLSSLVRVDRLREVACLYGFTRLEPAPSALESELDEIRLAVRGAPLDRRPTWFPSIEQFGEGIFLRLDSGRISEWSKRSDVSDWSTTLKAGETLDAKRRGLDAAQHLGIAYWTIHSLSHALMIELSLVCGYPLSSLKERIYASKSDDQPRHGLLIYTATSGGQGTLGGLAGMAASVPVILDRALDRLTTCSNDPVCGEHEPNDPHDARHLQGAACHACLLVPETSCEARNGRLDRQLVSTALGLFHQVI